MEGGREVGEGRGRMSESGREAGRERREERGSVRKNHAEQERVLVYAPLSY
jgi:hypothetical protein